MIEIGSGQIVGVAEPEKRKEASRGIVLRIKGPGRRHPLVQERPTFPPVLILVGRLVVKGDQIVLMHP